VDRSEKPKKGIFYSNLLSGKDYNEESVFLREQKKIFDRSWIFAGSAAQLKEEKDFLLLNFFDWSLIVGRYGGKIKIFENRCPHRSSQIYNCESGNRELKCPFHGWTFDAEGAARAIPQQREAFGFSDDDKKKLTLKNFKVEQIGELIFVRMPGCQKSLREFLGSTRDSLSAFDATWTTRNPWEMNEVKANWKIIVETALEAYHTNEVHPTSLGVQSAAPTEYYNFSSMRQGHQILNIGNHPEPHRMTTAVTIMFIFPNLFVIQIDGRLCSVLSMLPQKKDLTYLRSYTYFHRSVDLASAPFRALAKTLGQTNYEDQNVCEAVQRGIAGHQKGQPLGTIEEAIHQFQKDYLKTMSRFSF
jgi:phenylpropionate dioxygenase-like ring-hydroxylating dioxygenase large terminal subunit